METSLRWLQLITTTKDDAPKALLLLFNVNPRIRGQINNAKNVLFDGL